MNITLIKNSVKKQTRFLVCWNAYGLDSIYNVDEAEQQASWAKLKGAPFVFPYNINLLKLRAHRQQKDAFEIYIVSCDKSLMEFTTDFENDPQPLVDHIRTKGECIYSSYVADNLKKIK